jgi:hypothetical protein
VSGHGRRAEEAEREDEQQETEGAVTHVQLVGIRAGIPDPLDDLTMRA